MIDQLNARFAIPSAARFVAGAGGLPRLDLVHSSGASLQLYTHGAHIVSWTPGGREAFFVSECSAFSPSLPIRGGIPVVFPQFGDGPLPKHGFARLRDWSVETVARGPDGALSARLVLEDEVETRAAWPHRFRVEFEAQLAEALTIRLAVRNTGDSAFRFQVALHTYFAVEDIARAVVDGLEALPFVDTVGDGRRQVEAERAPLRFASETDRIYAGAPDRVVLRDEAGGRLFRLDKEGMRDAVVWNPWIDKARRMEDFGDDEYRRMVCVETGNMESRIELSPGAAWTGATAFRVSAAAQG